MPLRPPPAPPPEQQPHKVSSPPLCPPLLWWFIRGFPPSRCPRLPTHPSPCGNTPTVRGFSGRSLPQRPTAGVSKFLIAGSPESPLLQLSPLAVPPLCGGWGAGRTAAVLGAGPRAIRQGGGAPDWPAPAPPRARAYEEAEAAAAADSVREACRQDGRADRGAGAAEAPQPEPAPEPALRPLPRPPPRPSAPLPRSRQDGGRCSDRPGRACVRHCGSSDIGGGGRGLRDPCGPGPGPGDPARPYGCAAG